MADPRAPWGNRTAVMGVLNLTPDSFSDGGRLCYQCTAAEWREIAHDTVKGWASGWRAIDAAINWEGDDLHCDQCNRPIEPVYGTVEDAED